MFLINRKPKTFYNLLKQEYLFYIKYLSPGMVVFDVGANLGDFTLLFSRFAGDSGKIYSFEPAPFTYEKLLTIVRNRNLKNVTLNQLAISNIEGSISFNIYDEDHSTWNTSANRPLEKYGININPPEKINVSATTIDKYCEITKIDSIDLLKIDVEGAELNVLEGARNMFKSKKIKCCVFEFGQTTFDMGTSVEELTRFFKDIRYSVRTIEKWGSVFPLDNNSGLAQYSIHFAKPK